MWIKIARRMYSGIAWGGVATFIAITILMVNDVTPPIQTIWSYMSFSFVFGIYFAFSSLILETDKWNPLKKTSIHFTLSIVVYFLIALPNDWVPLHPLAIGTAILMFIIIYVLFFTGFHFYYKKLAQTLNQSLKKD